MFTLAGFTFTSAALPQIPPIAPQIIQRGRLQNSNMQYLKSNLGQAPLSYKEAFVGNWPPVNQQNNYQQQFLNNQNFPPQNNAHAQVFH